MAILPNQILVKVFAPGNKKSQATRFQAGRGRVFTADGVEQCLKHVADLVEAEYPMEEYELRRLAGGQFNFVWLGFKRSIMNPAV